MSDWQNRIVGEGVKPASQFLAHPQNWRSHPQNQRKALQASLSEVGWVQRVIENVRTGHLIDGHERIWSAMQNDDADVPYIQVDLSEQEEALVLATLDPIGAMAATDKDKLDELLRDVNTGEAALQEMLEGLAVMAGIIPPVDYDAEWQGMPEFEQEDLTAYRTLIVHFESQEAVDEFAELVDQTVTDKTKSIWYPKAEIRTFMDKGYIDES